MNEVIIERKKYVILPRAEYQALKKIAALKFKPEKHLSLPEARLYSKKLIHKWANEK